MRSAVRFRNDLINDLEVDQILSRDAKRCGGFLFDFGTLAVFPENCRATFHCDDRVHRVLEHHYAIGHTKRERTTGATFADDCGDDGHLKLAHFKQVARNGFALAAFFCTKSSPRTWCVDERD